MSNLLDEPMFIFLRGVIVRDVAFQSLQHFVSLYAVSHTHFTSSTPRHINDHATVNPFTVLQQQPNRIKFKVDRTFQPNNSMNNESRLN